MAQTWEYKGVDLTTLAYDVQLLGAPLNVPPRRQQNVVIPNKTGRTYVSKPLDERTVTLAMWVNAKHPTAGTPQNEAQFLSNIDTLRRIFGDDGQGSLLHTVGTVTRETQAEVVKAVEFTPENSITDREHYVFVVEFVMADPLWYSQSSTTVGPTTITTTSQNMTVTNNGTYQSERGTITVTGEIIDPKFAIGDYWVQYTGTVASGGTLVINMSTYTATYGTADHTGSISHDGGLVWLPIPGNAANTMTVTSGSVDGATVKVQFTEPYI